MATRATSESNREFASSAAPYATDPADWERFAKIGRDGGFHRARICEKLELKGAHALIKFAVEHRSHL